MESFKPNTKPLLDNFNVNGPIIFLGGSIEMGKARDWQVEITNALDGLPCTILNPRRDDWDPTWPQDPTPGTEFCKQVDWELLAQDIADVIVYYFVPGTQSPITLLELGLYAYLGNESIHVYCPKEFWRYGNVKIVCEKFGIDVYEDEQLFISDLRKKITK